MLPSALLVTGARRAAAQGQGHRHLLPLARTPVSASSAAPPRVFGVAPGLPPGAGRLATGLGSDLRPRTFACGGGGGPLGEWKGKAKAAALSLEETTMALRGASPELRAELQELARRVGDLRATLNDANYCTGRERHLAQLMVALAPLHGADASSQLLHPSRGGALRGELIEWLESWEERDVVEKDPAGAGVPRELNFAG
eukprot:CAMPEP_0183434002 /NCGR_PEP_ID=MMETSP0370-20130417/61752_1 /TAXON_ID=268820 /ORGANISM="Peridinium aciculiferum, Strain PAER-2" /LENGTH=199 /DNA_ID=CAMNT_0025620481 /DNA_START=101 /DNA_END=700 /DNA_ORIENTATION=+